MEEFKHGKITLLNCDCMEYMEQCKENEFDLAVVDPPYGLGKRLTRGGGSHVKFKNHAEIENWDIKPDKRYFVKLLDVSKNQIIWGGNYFSLGPCRGFLIWDKKQSVPNFSACEFAWNSIDCVSKIFRYRQAGCFGEEKIHPTQKPVDLYKWIYADFAQQNQRILDTHLGSASSAIAAHYAGLEFVGMEIDKEYFKRAVERFKRETRQLTLI